MSEIDTDSNKQSNMDTFENDKAYSFDDIVDNYKLYDYDSVKHHFYYENTNLGYVQSTDRRGPGGKGTRLCFILNNINSCAIYMGDVINGDKIKIKNRFIDVVIDRFDDAFVHKIENNPSPEDIRAWNSLLRPRIEERRKIEAQATPSEYTLSDSELDFEANTKFNADKFEDNTMYTFNYIINLYRIYDYDSVKHHFYYKDKDLGYIQRMTPLTVVLVEFILH